MEMELTSLFPAELLIPLVVTAAEPESEEGSTETEGTSLSPVEL